MVLMIIPMPLPPGLIMLTGDEGAGKTSLLRRLSGDLPAPDGQAHCLDALWLDLSLPYQDDETPQQVWDALRQR